MMDKKVKIAVLLGGLSMWGLENWFSSTLAGMYGIVGLLEPYGTVTTYPWGNWAQVKLPTTVKNVVIGYSGGGSRATYLANHNHQIIDLLIAIDPSPAWEVQSISTNVRKAICFENSAPLMPSPIGMLGGGKLVGNTKITTVPIAMQHLLVPYMSIVRETIIAAVRELVEARS